MSSGSTIQDIDVLILCGGLGTRLRSVVADKPKALATIQGKPFLELQLNYLMEQGCRRFILCTGYLSADIEAFIKRWQRNGCELILSQETSPLGTGGALRHAATHIKSEIFWALNGDSFCEISLAKMLQSHKTRGNASATLAVVARDNATAYGRVMVDQHGAVQAFIEKDRRPEAEKPGLINAGIYLLDRHTFLRQSPPERAFSLEVEFFPALVGRGLFAYTCQDGVFLDIGTPENYRRAAEMLSPFQRG